MEIVSWYQFKMDLDIKRLKSVLSRFFAKYPGILGTILLALEGINLNLSGSREDLNLVLLLLQNEGFDISNAKFNVIKEHAFHKIKVLVKKEICALKDDNLQNRINAISGEKINFCLHKKMMLISGKEWDKLLENNKNIVLDIRNDYEHEKGGFKGVNVVQPRVQNFHETIQWLKDNKALLKKYEKVGMYCTGGIRCEKLSFYLIENGYDNLVLLDGGIIQYINEQKDGNRNKDKRVSMRVKEYESSEKSLGNWQGDCFVFDDRGILNY